VSSDTQNDGDATSIAPVGDGDDSEALAQLEARLIELADEMGEVIEGGPSSEREALHDYAVSLVRERLPVAEASQVGEAAGSASTRSGESHGSGAASLFGYGVLLIPVGLVLVPVFGLVGFIVLLVGVMLATLGLVSGLVGRVKPRSSNS
jgi:hypothetical protein